jgi:hypothetical protein
VTLLLAHHLRASASQYADLPEIELVEEEIAIAKCDLLAVIDDRVIIAEVSRSYADSNRTGSGLDPRSHRRWGA